MYIDEVEFTRELSHGERFEGKACADRRSSRCQKLGYNLTVVAPGKRAFPFHCHHANEEMFFIVSGRTLRFGSAEYPRAKAT